jgi:hypothetical protein
MLVLDRADANFRVHVIVQVRRTVPPNQSHIAAKLTNFTPGLHILNLF